MSEFDTKRAVSQIRPEVVRAALALAEKRRARRETALFALAALVFFTLCGLSMMLDAWWIALAGGMGLTLIFAPLLTYFVEEDRSHET